MLPTLATNDDLKALATKEELRLAIEPLATKEELRLAIEPLATRKELKLAIEPLATREELREEGQRSRRHLTMSCRNSKTARRFRSAWSMIDRGISGFRPECRRPETADRR